MLVVVHVKYGVCRNVYQGLISRSPNVWCTVMSKYWLRPSVQVWSSGLHWLKLISLLVACTRTIQPLSIIIIWKTFIMMIGNFTTATISSMVHFNVKTQKFRQVLVKEGMFEETLTENWHLLRASRLLQTLLHLITDAPALPSTPAHPLTRVSIPP